jgi:hypothetical protein
MSSRLVQIRRSGTGLPVPGPAADPTADAGYQSAIDRNVDFSAVFADAMGQNPDLVEVDEPDATGGARVTVAITLTATACPCVEFIKWDVRDRVLQEDGVSEVDVRITWDPPWTTERITDRGREALRRAGVSI